jgi:hypothetical protein
VEEGQMTDVSLQECPAVVGLFNHLVNMCVPSQLLADDYAKVLGWINLQSLLMRFFLLEMFRT